MSLKEFLKPTKIKIILTALILFIPIPLPSETLCNCDTLGCQCPTYTGGILIIFFAIWFYGILGIQLLLIQIILSYLISCLIIWIYNKVKKK